jgi:hypothetical protein
MRYFNKGQMLPIRYHSWQFWLVRSALAIVGGFLAAIYNPGNLAGAVQIGASTPLILGAISETLPPQVEKRKRSATK